MTAGTQPDLRPPRSGIDRLRTAYLCAYGVSMLGTGMAFPLTALYLHEALEVSTAQVGLYFAVVAGTAMLVNPVAGSQSDRRGPLPVILVAVAFQTVGPLLLALAGSAPAALIAAVVSGAGGGAFFAVQNPLLAALFGKPALGRMYAAQYVIMNVAVAGAGVVAGLLVTRYGIAGYRTAFVVNGLSYASYGLVALGVVARRVPAQPDGTGTPRPSRPWHPYRDRGFLPLIGLQLGLVAFGFAQMEAVMPVVLRDAGDFSITLIAVFLAVNAITVVAVQPLATRACERIGSVWALRVALAWWLAALGLGLLAVQDLGTAAKIGALTAFAASFAVGETFISPSLQPLVAEYAPDGQLGAYSAAISLAYSLGLMAGPAVTLLAYGELGVWWYWAILAVGLGCCLVLLTRTMDRRQAEPAEAR